MGMPAGSSHSSFFIDAFVIPLVGFFQPLEVDGAAAGAKRAKAAEDDAKQEQGPGHGSDPELLV